MSTSRSILPAWSRAEVVPSRTARRAIGVLVFAVATVLSAKVSVPLPGTPIYFTFQPMVVILAGALLGARLGAASQIAYLALGLVGLPVFAAGGGAAYLMGPSGGYLMAYPLAAFVVGSLVGTGLLSILFSLLAGLVVIYAGGVAWLTVLGSFRFAVLAGLRPFVLADLVKVALATLVVARARGRALELFSR
jgi:biotin transport system substrate-specific component